MSIIKKLTPDTFGIAQMVLLNQTQTLEHDCNNMKLLGLTPESLQARVVLIKNDLTELEARAPKLVDEMLARGSATPLGFLLTISAPVFSPHVRFLAESTLKSCEEIIKKSLNPPHVEKN